ncbi:MAG TPA: LuxR C-terminal-related transcriptional regulator [Puia sp.]|jgi:DNA-binding CsgD family transcriptional regulator|nr:LuxR C-terminal-related transcriptional regulator [Puia sp.]
MKLEIFNNQANRIWKHLSDSEETTGELLKLELDFYKKLLVIFQVGESCCLIFNFQQLKFDFVSDDVDSLLGYPKAEITTELIMENIHPEDRAWFLNCQEVCGKFLLGLPPEKQMKYKLRIDYRIKRRSGEYFRVLHQAVVVHNDDKGKILRTLIVLTDISHLKQTGRPMLSYIGMDGEPSYQDVDVNNRFFERNGILTRREKEVLYHLAEGRLSKEIAVLLNLSKYTIDSHRKNLLQKMKVTNTGELINKAIKEGFI